MCIILRPWHLLGTIAILPVHFQTWKYIPGRVVDRVRETYKGIDVWLLCPLNKYKYSKQSRCPSRVDIVERQVVVVVCDNVEVH